MVLSPELTIMVCLQLHKETERVDTGSGFSQDTDSILSRFLVYMLIYESKPQCLFILLVFSS